MAAKLWKYNVHLEHLPICERHSLFAESRQNPDLSGGERLLLQIVKRDAQPHRRVTHVFDFDRYEADDQARSQQLWGTPYPYLMHGRISRLEQPFSLEDLDLSRCYTVQGKIGPEPIDSIDTVKVAAALAGRSTP